MARKQQTATDRLNVELARVDAGLTAARTLIAAMPDTPERKQALDALAEAGRGCAAASDRLGFIIITLNTL